MGNKWLNADSKTIASVLQGFSLARTFGTPPTGWLSLYRKGLSMSARRVGRALGCSHQAVLQFEKAEVRSSITLKSLRTMADALGCDLVYGLLPKAKSTPASPPTPATAPASAQKSKDLQGLIESLGKRV